VDSGWTVVSVLLTKIGTGGKAIWTELETQLMAPEIVEILLWLYWDTISIGSSRNAPIRPLKKNLMMKAYSALTSSLSVIVSAVSYKKNRLAFTEQKKKERSGRTFEPTGIRMLSLYMDKDFVVLKSS